MPFSKAARYAYTRLLCQHRRQGQNRVVTVVLSHRFQVTCTVGLLLFLTTGYIFWPSDPDLKIVRLKLKRVKVHPLPRITVDISMLLTLRVHNADVYSMDFGAVDVAVSYRGKELGHVTSEHGHVRARGSSYVNADVEFAGISLLSEMVLLLEDLAKGAVPFDTVSQVRGQLGLLFFHFPMK
ncbi:Late embryogenesis abundant protein [Sesbania bispinosa]|nr:Late embryogenesis abundant protein [Sesbania bispinosa]